MLRTHIYGLCVILACAPTNGTQQLVHSTPSEMRHWYKQLLLAEQYDWISHLYKYCTCSSYATIAEPMGDQNQQSHRQTQVDSTNETSEWWIYTSIYGIYIVIIHSIKASAPRHHQDIMWFRQWECRVFPTAHVTCTSRHSYTVPLSFVSSFSFYSLCSSAAERQGQCW